MLAWGKDYKFLPPFLDRDPIRLGGAANFVNLPWQVVWALATAVLHLRRPFSLFQTDERGPRHASQRGQPPRGADSAGIEPRRVMLTAYALSAAIGAAGGAVIAPVTMTGYDVGVMLGLKGFCGAIVGGLSSLPGAVVGGLALGLLEALSAGFLPSSVAHFKEILAFLALLGILYLRPAGLFGRRGA